MRSLKPGPVANSLTLSASVSVSRSLDDVRPLIARASCDANTLLFLAVATDTPDPLKLQEVAMVQYLVRDFACPSFYFSHTSPLQ